ncbi:hypothetical protein NEOLEDRAFT_1064715 [Neolentinus lepideus HHB14362 ss-1]|uniref:Macrophage erythroblast attacher n=1 Tax=Neolentinus lepideus HHB14362 ss-1 TaxID=1314782 RepID=A0A165SUY1_9AGAM|nr:hypothetical protein NEOLEDRAFT_1064715 [Neolentinus lepideus HHB14362 ss-1]
MSSTKLNVDGIMLFEEPFVRVPYENYRKVFRTSQRNIEKDMGALQNAATELEKRWSAGASDTDDAVKAVEGMIGKVENLKRKLSELHATSGKPTQEVMRQRLKYLAQVETMQSSDSHEFSEWADTRLDRWLVDWCLRKGKERTARSIADEKNIQRLVDIDLFSDIHRIEAALEGHSCSEALAWCSENKSALRKAKSTLEFDLRLQEYIELCRSSKSLEAIAYLKKHLVSWQDTHLAQIRHASALLAVTPETKSTGYKRLYDVTRWKTLVQAFRLAVYNLNTLPTEPLLHYALSAGLASLKLPACYDPSSQNVDCPVCDASLGQLAQEVPFSHHVNSTIVCHTTGKVMDEDNAPMAFPNGYVYSREVLEDMAAKNDGIVTCPRTNYICEYSALRRVFIS